jgi:hypothetical protein
MEEHLGGGHRAEQIGLDHGPVLFALNEIERNFRDGHRETSQRLAGTLYVIPTG